MEVSDEYMTLLTDFVKDPKAFDDNMDYVSKDNIAGYYCELCRETLCEPFYRYNDGMSGCRVGTDICGHCKDDPVLDQDKLVRIDLEDKAFLYTNHNSELIVWFQVPATKLIVPQQVEHMINKTDLVEWQRHIMQEDYYDRLGIGEICHSSVKNLFDLVPITPIKSDRDQSVFTTILVNCNPNSQYYKWSYVFIHYEENEVNIHLLFTSDDIKKISSELSAFMSTPFCFICHKSVECIEEHAVMHDEDEACNIEDTISFPLLMYYKYAKE